jgi:integrase
MKNKKTKAEIEAEEKLQEKLKGAKNVIDKKGKLSIQFKSPKTHKYSFRSTGLSTTVHNVEVAKRKLACIITDIVSGKFKHDPQQFWKEHFPLSQEAKDGDQSVLLSDLFSKFEEERKHELSFSMMNKFKTCKNWSKKFKLFDKPVQSITTAQLEKMRRESLKTRKVSTVQEYSNMFRQVIDIAIKNKTLKENPFKHVRKLMNDDYDVDEKKISPFSQNELYSLIDVVHIHQTKLLIMFLAWTGLRPGEAKALGWEDLDFKNNCLYVKYNLDRQGRLKPPKSKSSIRTVELLPATLKVLKELKAKSFDIAPRKETIHYKNYRTKQVSRRRIFLSRANQPYKRPELTTNRNHWRKWLTDAGIEYKSAYQLRHTYASQLLRVNADVRWLASQMGHADWGYLQTIYGKWIKNETPDYVKGLADQLGQKYEDEDKNEPV